MQTFLPVPDFDESAEILDTHRLGKQRVEGLQILKALDAIERGYEYGWKNHPAVLMWRGSEQALVDYTAAMCTAWRRRGFKDTVMGKLFDFARHGRILYPSWLGDNDFHASHRSNLLRKDSEFYAQYGWTEPATLPYVWPVDKPNVDDQRDPLLPVYEWND